MVVRHPPVQTAHALDVRAELHLPGLDLNQKRWTYHTIFMNEVHRHGERVHAQARDAYAHHGRGVLFVDAEQWLRLVKRSSEGILADDVFESLAADAARERLSFGPFQPGFEALLDAYDPQHQFVIVTCHHPGDMLSCYLVAAAPAEVEAVPA